MKTFSQFLTEESENSGYIRFNYLPSQITKIESLIKKIEKATGYSTGWGVKYARKVITINVPIDKPIELFALEKEIGDAIKQHKIHTRPLINVSAETVHINGELKYPLVIGTPGTNWFGTVMIDCRKLPSFKSLAKNLSGEFINIRLLFADDYRGGILSLLQIKGLDKIIDMSDMVPWKNILRKYIGTDDVLGCQEELIKSGLKEFARL